MKTAIIILLMFAAGLLISGCSTKTVPETPGTTGSTVAEDVNTADLNIDTSATNPDIGTLDNISVSDDLPQ